MAENRRSVALLFVFMVMAALAALTFGFLYMTSSRLRVMAHDIAGTQAFWLAEAGLARAIYRLGSDSDFRDAPATIEDSLGPGRYSVSIIKDADTYTLSSTGTVGLDRRVIRRSVIISDSQGGSYPQGAPEAFSFCMHSFGNHTKFHNCVSGTVNGDIAASITVQDEEEITVNGEVTDASSVDEPTPDPLQVLFDGYSQIADHVQEGGFTFEEGQTYSGLYYINGGAQIEDNVTINGSVIASGNIDMNKVSGVAVDAAQGYPALVAGGNILAQKIDDVTFNGLIYAGNNAHFQNSGNLIINGTILSGNNTEFQNCADFIISYDPDIIVNPPPFFIGYEGGGLTIKPQKDWQELSQPGP